MNKIKRLFIILFSVISLTILTTNFIYADNEPLLYIEYNGEYYSYEQGTYYNYNRVYVNAGAVHESNNLRAEYKDNAFYIYVKKDAEFFAPISCQNADLHIICAAYYGGYNAQCALSFNDVCDENLINVTNGDLYIGSAQHHLVINFNNGNEVCERKGDYVNAINVIDDDPYVSIFNTKIYCRGIDSLTRFDISSNAVVNVEDSTIEYQNGGKFEEPINCTFISAGSSFNALNSSMYTDCGAEYAVAARTIEFNHCDIYFISSNAFYGMNFSLINTNYDLYSTYKIFHLIPDDVIQTNEFHEQKALSIVEQRNSSEVYAGFDSTAAGNIGRNFMRTYENDYIISSNDDYGYINIDINKTWIPKCLLKDGPQDYVDFDADKLNLYRTLIFEYIPLASIALEVYKDCHNFIIYKSDEEHKYVSDEGAKIEVIQSGNIDGLSITGDYENGYSLFFANDTILTPYNFYGIYSTAKKCSIDGNSNLTINLEYDCYNNLLSYDGEVMIPAIFYKSEKNGSTLQIGNDSENETDNKFHLTINDYEPKFEYRPYSRIFRTYGIYASGSPFIDNSNVVINNTIISGAVNSGLISGEFVGLKLVNQESEEYLEPLSDISVKNSIIKDVCLKSIYLNPALYYEIHGGYIPSSVFIKGHNIDILNTDIKLNSTFFDELVDDEDHYYSIHHTDTAFSANDTFSTIGSNFDINDFYYGICAGDNMWDYQVLDHKLLLIKNSNIDIKNCSYGLYAEFYDDYNKIYDTSVIEFDDDIYHINIDASAYAIINSWNLSLIPTFNIPENYIYETSIYQDGSYILPYERPSQITRAKYFRLNPGQIPAHSKVYIEIDDNVLNHTDKGTIGSIDGIRIIDGDPIIVEINDDIAPINDSFVFINNANVKFITTNSDNVLRIINSRKESYLCNYSIYNSNVVFGDENNVLKLEIDDIRDIDFYGYSNPGFNFEGNNHSEFNNVDLKVTTIGPCAVSESNYQTTFNINDSNFLYNYKFYDRDEVSYFAFQGFQNIDAININNSNFESHLGNKQTIQSYGCFNTNHVNIIDSILKVDGYQNLFVSNDVYLENVIFDDCNVLKSVFISGRNVNDSVNNQKLTIKYTHIPQNPENYIDNYFSLVSAGESLASLRPSCKYELIISPHLRMFGGYYVETGEYSEYGEPIYTTSYEDFDYDNPLKYNAFKIQFRPFEEEVFEVYKDEDNIIVYRPNINGVLQRYQIGQIDGLDVSYDEEKMLFTTNVSDEVSLNPTNFYGIYCKENNLDIKGEGSLAINMNINENNIFDLDEFSSIYYEGSMNNKQLNIGDGENRLTISLHSNIDIDVINKLFNDDLMSNSKSLFKGLSSLNGNVKFTNTTFNSLLPSSSIILKSNDSTIPSLELIDSNLLFDSKNQSTLSLAKYEDNIIETHDLSITNSSLTFNMNDLNSNTTFNAINVLNKDVNVSNSNIVSNGGNTFVLNKSIHFTDTDIDVKETPIFIKASPTNLNKVTFTYNDDTNSIVISTNDKLFDYNGLSPVLHTSFIVPETLFVCGSKNSDGSKADIPYKETNFDSYKYLYIKNVLPPPDEEDKPNPGGGSNYIIPKTGILNAYK